MLLEEGQKRPSWTTILELSRATGDDKSAFDNILSEADGHVQQNFSVQACSIIIESNLVAVCLFMEHTFHDTSNAQSSLINSPLEKTVE